MRIAILGSGNIGGSLGRKWAAAGHEVVFGVRDVASPKVAALLANFDGAVTAVPIPEALSQCELVLLAIPHGAVPALAHTYAAALAGKILIDATNDFGATVVNNVEPIQTAVPTATIFRAFNSLGWENFAEPQINSVQVDHFYCGPEGAQRPLVEQLIRDVGLRPVYVGGLDAAPIVDALGQLWMTLAFRRGLGRRLAFKMMVDEPA